jgi:hypothetical protein
MRRAEEMAARLPPLYREGELVAALLAQPALQVEIVEECLLEIQRAHFFDAALERGEAAGLAALLDFTPEPWQNLSSFRAWVHAQRDAVLQGGAVTAQAIRGFVTRYSDAYEAATAVRFHQGGPALRENPPRRRTLRPEVEGAVTPLTQFTVEDKGLDESPASFLLTGLPAGPESVPLIANLTTGEGLLFMGNVGPGQRLWLRARPDGSVEGQLEHQDVTDRLRTVTGLTPGEPWGAAQVQAPARALRLVRGANRLWFLPVAHHDQFGLDRFLLALADLALAQGKWDEARLDHAVFFADAAVKLLVTWVETEPASIEVALPTESVRRSPLASGTAEQARVDLAAAIGLGVDRLRAAGVRSDVRALAFSELQGQSDAITAVLPLRLREAGSTGADRIPESGGLFDVTGYGDSLFR